MKPLPEMAFHLPVSEETKIENDKADFTRQYTMTQSEVLNVTGVETNQTNKSFVSYEYVKLDCIGNSKTETYLEEDCNDTNTISKYEGKDKITASYIPTDLNFECDKLSANLEFIKPEYVVMQYIDSLLEIKEQSLTEEFKSTNTKMRNLNGEKQENGETSTNPTDSKARRYECTLCDYRAKFKCILQRHINVTHLKSEVFACKFCEYKAHQKDTLKSHVISQHTRDETFKCQLCNYKTHTKGNLKFHTTLKHTDGKLFECQYCDYKTRVRNTFNAHVNIHTKDNVYECGYCDFKTYRKGNLRAHISNQHTGKHLECKSCDFKAQHKSEFRIHTKKMHGNL